MGLDLGRSGGLRAVAAPGHRRAPPHVAGRGRHRTWRAL